MIFFLESGTFRKCEKERVLSSMEYVLKNITEGESFIFRETQNWFNVTIFYCIYLIHNNLALLIDW